MSKQITKAEAERLLEECHEDIRSAAAAMPGDIIKIIRERFGDQLPPETLDSIEAKAKELVGGTMIQVDHQLAESLSRLEISLP